MVTLPGWDSIESAARLHRWFEILGFLALGLLLLFEVLAYIYGNRKDYLASEAAGVAAETQREKEAKANQLRDAQIAEADRQARDARQAQMLDEERAAPRHLTEGQKRKLSAFLSDKPTCAFTIKATIAASDARAYADQIAELFKQAGWTVRVDNAIITGPDASGLWITVKDALQPPKCAEILQQTFGAAGITVRGQFDSTLPSGDEIWLSIGSK